MTDSDAGVSAATVMRAMVLPLVLAQFICSYAASSLNVAISVVASDLDTTVSGVQAAITIFTLTMAALMIPGSKISDISTRMFRDRAANLGLLTQNVQWLVLLGLSFVVSVFLQTVRGYSAIETGLILTPATVGILVSSMAAARLAARFSQALLIRVGFIVTIVGIVALLWLADATSSVLTFVPGLTLVGLGVGVMLTSSVNVVQSSFPEHDQGEISGLSRSVSNLGSSLGVAIAGTIIVSNASGNEGYGYALITLAAFGFLGLLAAALLPTERVSKPASAAVAT